MVRFKHAPLPLAAIAVATALAGCGGGSDTTTAKPAAPTATDQQVAVSQESGTTKHASSSKTTKSAAGAKKAAGRQRASGASKSSRAGSSSQGGQSSTGAQTPSTKTKAGTSPPITCLQKANLHAPKQQQPGLWAASSGSDNAVVNRVLVDGPYKTTTEASRSAASLAGASIAESGGIYVVSATITSRLGNQVHRVALCLGNGFIGAKVKGSPNAAPGQP